MSFLARFHWWRKLRGGAWMSDCVTGKHWYQTHLHDPTIGFHESSNGDPRDMVIADLNRRVERAEKSEQDFYRQIQLLVAQLEMARKQYDELQNQLQATQEEIRILKSPPASYTFSNTPTTKTPERRPRKKKKPRGGIANAGK